MASTGSETHLRQVAAAVIGNALEWYDFIVFGFMAAIISPVFFPAGDAYAALLLTTASFGVGFVMRPVGGILIGIHADRRGRKSALQLIIALMALATALLAFAPPYTAIGVGSSLIVVVARMLQGLATGGEFASSTALLIELAPAGRRGLYGSWQMVGQGLALLAGTAIGALITHLLSPLQLHAWGWRIPFAIGLLIAPVGFWIRRHLQEPDASAGAPRRPQDAPLPMARALGRHGRALLSSALLTASVTIAFYVLVIYMPTFASRSLGIALDAAFGSQCVAVLAMTLVTPFAGAASDRIGRRPLIIASLVGYFLLLLPLFGWLLAAPGAMRLMITQTVLCCVLGLFLGPYAAALAEQFPARIRSTGMAISYNITVMIFGGFAQFFLTLLLHITGSPLSLAFYLLFGAALGIVGSLLLGARDEPAAQSGRLAESVGRQ
ncbi:MFS transporter [Burkholderia plantarii]|uniref:Major facilitator superfamily n=1 Tax=Burkholderia plantarii TaxID=41899 RepID=A0A0B6RZT4_BURPL|nr:MFS transporter [Burkholderia plantarii]AJK46605.1 major facilitator superfamily [Burkholderia plantarii]